MKKDIGIDIHLEGGGLNQVRPNFRLQDLTATLEKAGIKENPNHNP